MLTCIVLNGCTTQDNNKDGDVLSFGNIHIINHGLVNTSLDKVAVKGLAKNIGEREFTLVQIRVNFYDKYDSLIDSSVDIASNIEPEEVWIFEINCYKEGFIVDDYTIGVGNVWYV